MTHGDVREYLGSTPFFADILTPAELDALASAARIVEFESNSTLVVEGDPSDTMDVLMHGSVSVSIADNGEDRLVATLPAGEIVGAMSLLTGAPRAGTVAAEGPVVAIEIDRSAIRPVLQAEPLLFHRFATMLEKRQTELDKLYGPGIWALYGQPRANLAKIIRTYFADLPGRR